MSRKEMIDYIIKVKKDMGIRVVKKELEDMFDHQLIAQYQHYKIIVELVRDYRLDK